MKVNTNQELASLVEYWQRKHANLEAATKADKNALKEEVAGLNKHRKELQARHTALVEAVKIAIKLLREDVAGFDTIEDQNDYIRLRLDAALAAVQTDMSNDYFEKAVACVRANAAGHDNVWQDEDSLYWLAGLMSEVGELAESLVGTHDHLPIEELMQIGGIVTNWIERELRGITQDTDND